MTTAGVLLGTPSLLGVQGIADRRDVARARLLEVTDGRTVSSGGRRP